MTDRHQMSPRFAKRAARMNARCEKLWLKPPAENRVKEILRSWSAPLHGSRTIT